MKNIIKKKNANKYWFLFSILIFALISSFFFIQKKTVIIFNKNKEMHWGFPGSTPSAPRMRNF